MAVPIIKLLETYRGRDRVLRLGTYISMLIGGSGNTPINRYFNTFAQEFNACRTTLRLFDDLAMIGVNLKYWYGPKDKSPLLRTLDLISICIGQSYYVVEHIAWLSDKKILQKNSGPWWVACISIWALTLILDIFKNILRIMRNKKAQVSLKKQRQLDRDDRGSVSEQNQEINQKLIQLKKEEAGYILHLVQSMADILNAVNWLPPGVLWSGKFSRAQSGIFGIISSSLLLYRNGLPQ